MEKVMGEIEIFNKEIDWDKFHSPENLAKSISIEAGEILLFLYSKNKQSYTQKNSKKHLNNPHEVI